MHTFDKGLPISHNICMLIGNDDQLQVRHTSDHTHRLLINLISVNASIGRSDDRTNG